MAGQEAIAGYLGCDYPLIPSRGDPDADGKSPFMGLSHVEMVGLSHARCYFKYISHLPVSIMWGPHPRSHVNDPMHRQKTIPMFAY